MSALSETENKCGTSEVLTAVRLKIRGFWYVMLCWRSYSSLRFILDCFRNVGDYMPKRKSVTSHKTPIIHEFYAFLQTFFLYLNFTLQKTAHLFCVKPFKFGILKLWVVTACWWLVNPKSTLMLMA